MTLEISIIFSRLEFIVKNLEKLKRFETITLTEYLDNIDLQIISERLLAVIIRASIDINRDLLNQGYQINLLTDDQTFLKLGENEIIAKELSEELSRIASLNNVLAYEYLNIDYSKLFTSIQKVLLLYPLYIKHITQYLDKLGQ